MNKSISEHISKERKDYKNIFDNMLEVLYRSDNEGRIILISPSAVDVFGYSSTEEFLGKKIQDVFYKTPSDRKLLLDELEKYGKVVNYPLVLKKKDGSVLHAKTTSYFIFDDQGNRTGIEGIVMDTSEQFIAEQALQQAADIVHNIRVGIYIYHLEDLEDDRRSGWSRPIRPRWISPEFLFYRWWVKHWMKTFRASGRKEYHSCSPM